MKFETDKEFSEYIERRVSELVEGHFDAVDKTVIEHAISHFPNAPFDQEQVDFLATLTHNYSKAGAKFGALVALEMVQNLNQLNQD